MRHKRISKQSEQVKRKWWEVLYPPWMAAERGWESVLINNCFISQLGAFLSFSQGLHDMKICLKISLQLQTTLCAIMQYESHIECLAISTWIRLVKTAEGNMLAGLLGCSLKMKISSLCIKARGKKLGSSTYVSLPWGTLSLNLLWNSFVLFQMAFYHLGAYLPDDY